MTEMGTVTVALTPGAVEAKRGEESAGEATDQSPQRLATGEPSRDLTRQLIEIEPLAHDRFSSLEGQTPHETPALPWQR
jgi:hypothetical protein